MARPGWLLLLPLLSSWAACHGDDGDEAASTAGGAPGAGGTAQSAAAGRGGDAAGATVDGAGAGGAPGSCADDTPPNAWASWPLRGQAVAGAAGQSSFTPSDDVVIDEATGLVWQRHLAEQPLTWRDAKQYCDCLSLAGYDDWGLPSRMELVSIVDETKQNPSIDEEAFPGTPLEWFWSASPLAGQAEHYWYVAFFDGDTHAASAEQLYWARCVRHQRGELPRYDVSPGGTVTDASTGLAWQRDFSEKRVAWPEADAACSELGLDGGGWRLPSMQELQSLIDESRVEPAIDPEAFPATPSEGFWAATPLAGVPGSSWFVSFREGVAYNAVYEHPYRFRCVR